MNKKTEERLPEVVMPVCPAQKVPRAAVWLAWDYAD